MSILSEKESILCKKDFRFGSPSGDMVYFTKGKIYQYYINFEGLNHIVSDGENVYPFDGDHQSARPYIFDFFYTKEEMRDVKIDEIIEESFLP